MRYRPRPLLSLAVAAFAAALVLNVLPACAPRANPSADVLKAQFPFEDPSLPMDQRARDLVSRMTLEEKVSQMQMDAPAIERLDIPAYHWWNEALHGIARNGPATVFPQAIGMAATWNPELLHNVAQVIALEARAKHEEAMRNDKHGIYTGLDLWAPNINIFRDPRWGRGQETYGEDPYLTSRLAVAYVTGIQGDDPVYFQAIATPKHFAVHSGPESDRHRLNVDITQRDLWGTYLPGFEAAIREGHAYSIMGAYNSLDGLPCCANPMLLTDILRKDWGFSGFVVSDVGAITDIYVNHEAAASPEEAAVMAVNAGCDLDGGTYYKNLVTAVRLNHISEAKIDQAVTRLMLGRLRLGMFDRPSTLAYAQTPITEVDSPEHEELARETARQSIVLLKNSNNLLPLPKSLPTIAVIGPTADSLASLVGNYNGDPARPVTILQGIRNAVAPTTHVVYAQGCPLVSELLPLEEPVPASALFTDPTQRTPGLRANFYSGPGLAGAPFRTRIDSQVDFDWSIPSPRHPMPTKPFSGAWAGTLVAPVSGTYQLGITGAGGFRIYLDGVRILDDWSDGQRHSVGARLPLQQGTAYAIRIEYFHAKNDAAIQFRWTRPDAEPFYADAVRAAQSADSVIMVLGLTAGLEREQDTTAFHGFAGGDRQSLDLPPVQQELLQAVAATGKPITLVLTGGSALSINWAKAHVPAIVDAWYPGEQGGSAVADVLFGDYNPAGKLPVTFYQSVKDLPPMDDYSMDGRTYRYYTGEPPLFPFGYGLSYTTFHSDIGAISPEKQGTTDNVTVSVNVQNTGDLAGDEIVQLYTSRPDAAHAPICSLQGFMRVHLKPKEKRTVDFTLTPYQLAVLDDEGRRTTPPGRITLSLASNDKTPSHSFTLEGAAVAPAYVFVPPKVR